MDREKLNEQKAAAIMTFVDLIIGAFESGHVTTNTLTIAQLHRIAEHHCADNFGAKFGNIIERHGEELAKECGLNV